MYFFLLAGTQAILITPMVAGVMGGIRFFENIGLTFAFYIGSGIILSLLLILLLKQQREWQRKILTAVHFIWISFFAYYFFSHSQFIREAIPAPMKFAALFGIILAAGSIRIIQREQLNLILGSLSLAFLAGDLFTISRVSLGQSSSDSYQAKATPSQRPPIFHIIFDRFSFPFLWENPAIKKEILELTEKYQLTLYENAHSNASVTAYSIPDLLRVNRNEPFAKTFDHPTQNVAFKYFHDQGFQVNIWGESMPYCLRFSLYTNKCYTKSIDTDWTEEVYAAGVLYLAEIARQLPQLFWGQSAESLVFRYPQSSLKILADVKNLILSKQIASSGSYTYIHVLAPHHPFVLDANCQVIRHADEQAKETREQIMQYQNQSSCILKQFAAILETLAESNLLESSKLLVHSDHGGRFLPYNHDFANEKLNSLDVSQASHIVAWTKHPYQKQTHREKQLVSNEAAFQFLSDPNAKTLSSSSTIEFTMPLHDKRFKSTDGKDWQPIDR